MIADNINPGREEWLRSSRGRSGHGREKQSDQIDDFIAKSVVAIVLVPVDRISIGPAVKQANAAGIPVFTVDAKCAARQIEGHVGTDNYQGGELAGQAMISPGEEGGKVLILDEKANSRSWGGWLQSNQRP